ncbi:bifunctional DNA primase/polymerase [Actinosynnema sp. CS-041913]|uniref:bifunctional DNA primase/polymerase n=1 Tax=Actinosynnema sp. CS-041913 TaxID=3239917 RepID=UPI003D8F30D3
MSITLIPDGALAALLDHADQAREAAHALTPRARLLTAAYLLRDRFPNATIVLVDSTFHHIDPVGVEIDGIEDGDGNLLWGNGCLHSPDFPCRNCMQADLCYRTADDATWDDVVQQVATNLTKAPLRRSPTGPLAAADRPARHSPRQPARHTSRRRAGTRSAQADLRRARRGKGSTDGARGTGGRMNPHHPRRSRPRVVLAALSGCVAALQRPGDRQRNPARTAPTRPLTVARPRTWSVMATHLFRDAAMAAACRGWPVFPAHPRSKRPALTEWEQRASTDIDRIERWWTRRPTANPAVATGPAGLVVLDLDDAVRHGHIVPREPSTVRHGKDAFAQLSQNAATQVSEGTFTVRTPNNGMHLYFAAPAGVELHNTQSRLGPLIDTRAHGGYVLAAGAETRQGHYEIIDDVPVQALPDWLVDALAPRLHLDTRTTVEATHSDAYLRAALADETRRVRTAPPGTRRHSLLRAACRMGRLPGLGDAVITSALRAASDRHVADGAYSLTERERAIADGIAWGREHPRLLTFAPTDGERGPERIGSHFP